MMSRTDSVVPELTHKPWTCQVCSESHATSPVMLPPQPADVGFTYESQEAARAANQERIELVLCPTCGLIRNLAFAPERIAFEAGYSATLDHSDVHREHTERIVEQIAQRLTAMQRPIFLACLKIGCGDGELLRKLASTTKLHGIGIDPTLSISREEQTAGNRLEFIASCFDESIQLHGCDLILCRSVLEDIANPVELLKHARRHLVLESGQLYLEVFNGASAFQSANVWSVHYEQANYYSIETLKHAARLAGFSVLEAKPCLDDQHLCLWAANSPSHDATPALDVKPNESLAQFACSVVEGIHFWRQRLTELKRQNERVVLWGTGGKGVCYLNYVDPFAQLIPVAVDINPARHGRYVAGSGHRIVCPESLVDFSPTRVLAANAVYLTEIQSQLSHFGLDVPLESLDIEAFPS